MSAPEPWTVHAFDSRIVLDAEGLVVADVRVALSEGGHAVALKLAAAPDLLKAARAVVSEVLASIPPGATINFSPAVQALIRAADKAVGA